MPSIEALLQRTATDAKFRAQLLAAPAAALREAGAEVPANAAIEVIEARPNDIHLNLRGKGRPPFLQKVLDRAETDPEFRRNLLANPKKLLGQALGQEIPAGVNVRVHEPGPLRLFLPPFRSDQDAELSDAELEAVAGGGFFANVREWVCKDHDTVVLHTDGTYDAMVDTSNKAPTKKSGDWFVW